MKRTLLIAPMPPPATGISIVTEKIFYSLRDKYKFIVINLSKNSFEQGRITPVRIIRIFQLLLQIIKVKKNTEIIYLTISQSIAGNLRDLIILFLCRRKKIILHFHGGGIGKVIYEKYHCLYLLNKWILKYVELVIVLSKSLQSIFHNIIPHRKIKIVQNFADNSFFILKGDLEKKFRQPVFHIVFLSNMIEEKGYRELLYAVLKLNELYREKITLTFIGAFLDEKKETEFKKIIRGKESIYYLGPIYGVKRTEYLKRSHIFCLPTYNSNLEGQPISILEAYASGCCVLTTNHGGIRDIFVDGINGYFVRKKSISDLQNKIIQLLESGNEHMVYIAKNNLELAQSTFREKTFIQNMDRIFQSF